MGLWKGKKGSSVFYKIWNSNNKEKQGIREYQPEVRNPQTDYQADQRMKMLPAQLIKGALRDIVSRSFQGIAYGSKSRLEFMKYALRAETYPYPPKGFTEPVPGEYLISRGTIQQVGCAYNSVNEDFTTTLIFTISMDDITVAAFSTEILTRNNFLKEGDQLTFVGCFYGPTAEANPFYNWAYWSMVLDTQNGERVGDLKGSDTVLIGLDSDVNRITLSSAVDNICAAGVIVSRQGEDGLYLRSNCTLAIDEQTLAIWFAEETRAGTRASYQTGQTRSFYDWPVEEGGETAGTEDGAYTLSGLQGAIAPLNGRQVKVRVNSGTGIAVACYISSESTESTKFLVDLNGNALSYSQQGEITYLRQDQVTALANLPTIVYTRASTRAAMAVPMVEDEKPEAEAEEKKTRSKK